MKTQITKALSGLVTKTGFALKKHSPEILVVSGIVGLIGSAVWACVNTRKLDNVQAQHQHNIDALEHDVEEGEIDEEDAKKEAAKIYAMTGLRIARLYVPPVTLAVLSAVSILASYGILRKRNVALAAAVSSLTQTFQEYRNRVIERFGDDVDRDLRFNTHTETIEEKVTDENGKTRTVKKKINVVDPDFNGSEFAVIFGDKSREYNKNLEVSLAFLHLQEKIANNMLITHGHLFWNEILDNLDLPRTVAGQVCGWIYDPTDTRHDGDNYISFNTRVLKRKTENGYEDIIVVDPNVDGDILHSNKIERALLK